jgi:hypothetical protein
MLTLADQNKIALVAAKADEWANKLIDLGPRNTLLHFKNTKIGSLDLSAAEPTALHGLLGGVPTRLGVLVPDPTVHKDACVRARNLRQRILTFEEEQGVEVGRIAMGLVEVPPPTTVGTGPVRALRAPLLLRPVSIVPRTVAETDFVLQPGEDFEVNQVLLYALDRQYGFDIDVAAVAAKVDAVLARTTDADERLASAFAVLEGIAGRQRRALDLERSTVIGLFNYEKLPMVLDLRNATELLAGHDLVAACGASRGGSAPTRCRPNCCPPAAWFADRHGETDRIVKAWEAAMRTADSGVRTVVAVRPVLRPPVRPTVDRGPRPPVVPGLKSHEYTDDELIRLCRWLMTDRLQRDRTERIEEAMRELGFQRKGSRITERLGRAVEIAQAQADRMER